MAKTTNPIAGILSADNVIRFKELGAEWAYSDDSWETFCKQNNLPKNSLDRILVWLYYRLESSREKEDSTIALEST